MKKIWKTVDDVSVNCEHADCCVQVHVNDETRLLNAYDDYDEVTMIVNANDAIRVNDVNDVPLNDANDHAANK